MLVGHKIELGYLEQTAVSGSELSVWDEARSRMVDVIAAEKMLEDAGKAMEAGDPNAGEVLQRAQDAFDAADGATADRRVANVLTGLGFKEDQHDKKGGSGLLLLDEPTNHLDKAAIKWLGSFLRKSSGTFVIVSHDEQLLQDACDHIVEVRGKQLHHYVGTFAKFLEQRAERDSQMAATASAQAAEIARLQTFVDRMGAKASKASQAQSRVKLIDKLKKEQVSGPTKASNKGAGGLQVSGPTKASSEGAGDFKKVTLTLPKAPACHTEVLQLTGGVIGYGEAAPGKEPLLTSVDLTVKRGQRILVLGPNGAGKSTLMKVFQLSGPNGAGKSTLMKALGGSLPMWGGKRKEGDGVRLSYFSQDLAQDLPLEMCPLDYVEMKARAHDPNITVEKCRQAVGALGLQNSMALTPIGVLSGGEKARAALAAFALVPCNCLLLDEASNHLDAATISVLTGALQDFQGAIVAITHNPSFAASLNATHILRVQNGRATLTDKIGPLSDADFDHPAESATPVGAWAPAAAAAVAAAAPKAKTSNKGGFKAWQPPAAAAPAASAPKAAPAAKAAAPKVGYSC
ncbi:hypothetical protein FOA52_008135 [Chlamydomonas sp. UWO 241]|nr:hypothetical protein FOA52_008135 [Chlamydomonas sp. UWO 241]